VRQAILLPPLYVRKASISTASFLYFEAFLSITPEEDPRAHPHMTGTTLEVPLVNGIVVTTPPNKVSAFTLALLAPIWVNGERVAQTIRFIMEGDPQEVDCAVTLVTGQYSKFIEI
jgi:hypothetical protein